MTAIAGFVYGPSSTVWIGGDSAGIAGLDLTVRADQKVFTKGEFAIGFTTSFRMGQLIRYKLVPPQHPDGMEAFEYMATLFVDGLRQCLKDGGYAEKHNEAEKGGTFLIGYRGRLFRIESDYQVAEPMDNYDACGCGAQVALGVLRVTQESTNPYERMMDALKAAEHHNAGVRGPFHHAVTP